MEVSCQLHDWATSAPLSTEEEAKKLAGPQSKSGFSREKKNLLPLVGIKPLFLSCPTHSLVTILTGLSLIHKPWREKYVIDNHIWKLTALWKKNWCTITDVLLHLGYSVRQSRKEICLLLVVHMTNCKSYKKMDWTIFELSPSFQFVKNIQKYAELLKWFFKKWNGQS